MENNIAEILKNSERVEMITFKGQGESEEVALFEVPRLPVMAIQKSINASPGQNPLKRKKK